MIGDRFENELSVSCMFGNAGKSHIAEKPSKDIHLIRLDRRTKDELSSSAAREPGAAAHRSLLDQFDADAAVYADTILLSHYP